MSDKKNYYTGGLAELLPNPSHITHSYLEKWFVGAKSVGAAMEILGLPYQHCSLPILALHEGNLVVDLENEEETLYKKTIFKYLEREDIHVTPVLKISLSKILSPVCLFNTMRIVATQSNWIAKPNGVVQKLRNGVQHIPEASPTMSLNETEELLVTSVWPYVIATGLIAEFYNQLLLSESKNDKGEIDTYISEALSSNDWFFKSLSDQHEVRCGRISFEEYIKNYGTRSDKDYELTYPRWHELKDTIRERIKNSQAPKEHKNTSLNTTAKLQKIIDYSIQFQLLRSEAKKTTLQYIDILRKKLIEEKIIDKSISHSIQETTLNLNVPMSGKGISVSKGTTLGNALNIITNDMKIPSNTIGIFPNASPEFAAQYPKCSGMIFLKGGQTSHGAIVAREFKIPAIIETKLIGIPNDTKIEINGLTGIWNIT